ncbi:hypothetical protein [Fuchsiella alkaliacetigena]|uniref:hypothetical protein n=1 Tax=Fuchsiella alkaliacetigena TaxID=957042 RepID=UPI00200B1973|nr:hypothetical protein [Fuchsiella alkaliacetigena]MCK8824659.1 hypothetical protein [Fuchsiella alkaliacetigena]
MSRKDLATKTKAYLEKYRVQDLINEQAVVLFILESPHVQEVKHGYPVAGSSGVEMAKFIYGPATELPLGRLVKHKSEYIKQYPNLDKFALLNVAPAPMQSSAIETELSVEEQQVVEVLEKLRVNYDANQHRKPEWNIVKKILLSNFRQRLVSACQNCSELEYIVPCGRLAARYLSLIDAKKDIIKEKQVIDGIPHPAFNQWSRADSMFNLKEVLAKLN